MLVFAIIVISSILLLWLLFRDGGAQREERREERREEEYEREEDRHEILYATTPINKVDDYEFSRIFGYERDGRMVVPPQDFNKILDERRFDWPDKPMSSDARKPLGVVEGFTADGRLSSKSTKEAILQGCLDERREEIEEREVERLVDEAYSGDPDYAPILTYVGGNQWAVSELVPRREKRSWTRERERDPRDREITQESWEDRVDPFFPSSGYMMGEGTRLQRRDPFSGPVPNMERMFGPTFDHTDWIVKP